MWERERGDKVIKKETEEEEEEGEVCENTIQNHSQEILQVNSNYCFRIKPKLPEIHIFSF